MSRSALYGPASQGQSYSGGKYAGSTMELAAPVLVLHTTEGNGWPAYASGGEAPTMTYWAQNPQSLSWRQHFRINESSRALMNKAGGVSTNTAGTVQVELIGTCDQATANRIPGIMYWPTAPDWALQGLADFVAWLGRDWGLPLVSTPRPWLAYGPDSRRPGITPASYGNSPARMSFDEWNAFSGICGHQHVPENDHGDPGNFPIGRLLQLAKGDLAPRPATPANTTPAPTPIPRQDDDMGKPLAIKVGNTTALISNRGMTQVYSAEQLASVELWRGCLRSDGSLDEAKAAKTTFTLDDVRHLREVGLTA